MRLQKVSILCKEDNEIDNEMTNKVHSLIKDTDGFIIFCDNGFYDKINDNLGYSHLLSKLGNYNEHLNESVKTKQFLEDNITIALKVFF